MLERIMVREGGISIIYHILIGIADAVVCRGNMPFDMLFSGDDRAVGNS